MAKKKDITKIRAAVTKNRGGLTGATDNQIMKIWQPLDEPTQKAYLESIKNTETKKKGQSDAAGTGTNRDI